LVQAAVGVQDREPLLEMLVQEEQVVVELVQDIRALVRLLDLSGVQEAEVLPFGLAALAEVIKDLQS
jgi:hypothetical protein